MRSPVVKLPLPAPSAPETKEEGAHLDPAGVARLTAMLRTHHALLWRTAYRMGLNRAQADDATQQAFLVAMRRLAEIREGSERAFLVAAVIHASRRLRSTAAARHECLDSPAVDEAAAVSLDVDELVELKRSRLVLERILSTFPDHLREPFVLFELEGLALLEICELLGLSMGTLASRLRRARQRFERAVSELRGAGE